MKKLILFIVILALAAGAFLGLRFYNKYYSDNVEKEGYLLIPHNGKFGQILDSIKPYLKDEQQFKDVAVEKQMNQFFKAGRYRIKNGYSNTELINMIKAGNQTEDVFRIKDFMDVYQMIGRVTKKTEIDSAQFIAGLDAVAKEKGLNKTEDLKKFFFINTYNFYWTVTPQEFFKKFDEQYNAFWNENRKNLEQKSGLSRNQIYALASIVYKESGGKPDEMKTIAGLYLNRYRKGMKLQSDPTVIYAVNKETDFKDPIRRVFYKHLRVASPYNTYANAGIPPGPICVVDKNSVDAVLDAENNNYIYMCADPAKSGYHKFTANAEEHVKNAKEYQDWLNSKNIK